MLSDYRLVEFAYRFVRLFVNNSRCKQFVTMDGVSGFMFLTNPKYLRQINVPNVICTSAFHGGRPAGNSAFASLHGCSLLEQCRSNCRGQLYGCSRLITSGASCLQDAGKEREHDAREGGGRVMLGAITEERKLYLAKSCQLRILG